MAYVVHEPTHELDAVHLALLVDTSRQNDLEQALSDLASDWQGRIGVRLLGPMTPYDYFTTTPVVTTTHARNQQATMYDLRALEGLCPEA